MPIKLRRFDEKPYRLFLTGTHKFRAIEEAENWRRRGVRARVISASRGDWSVYLNILDYKNWSPWRRP